MRWRLHLSAVLVVVAIIAALAAAWAMVRLGPGGAGPRLRPGPPSAVTVPPSRSVAPSRGRSPTRTARGSVTPR